jgi:hypothetical protein
MRICDKCGWDNGDAQTDGDLWCAQCQNFLGFPAQSQSRPRERRLAVRLVNSQTSVAPGGEAMLAAVVRNSGDVVEKVSFAIEGSPADWALVEPPEVGLFPNQQAEVRVVFRLPRSSRTSCGVTPFRLVATSQSDATVSDRAEGTLDVGAFVEVSASLNPLRSTGSSGADHRLALENGGNTVIDILVTAAQPGTDLEITVKPESLQLAPGEKGEARVDVVPSQPLYSAVARTYPFSVRISAQGQASITIQAQHVQEATVTAPTLVLADSQLHAAPGEEVTTTVTIRNRGRGGDDYSLELLGPAALWGRATPPVIALPSAGEVTATIVFTPPVSPPALASEIPFGLRCRSQDDGGRSVVAEAVLTVKAVADIDFEIEPKRVRSRWSSRHVIDIENRGNATADLRPVIVDYEHDLSLAVSPSQLHMPAGSRDLVLVKARARRPKLLSKPSDRSFRVAFVPAGHPAQNGNREDEDARDLNFEQIPVLPRKLTALVIFIAFVATLVGGALLTLGPQINHWF